MTLSTPIFILFFVTNTLISSPSYQNGEKLNPNFLNVYIDPISSLFVQYFLVDSAPLIQVIPITFCAKKKPLEIFNYSLAFTGYWAMIWKLRSPSVIGALFGIVWPTPLEHLRGRSCLTKMYFSKLWQRREQAS